MHLNNDVLEKVKQNKDCRNRLAYEMKVNGGTVTRWLYEVPHNIMLTTAIALQIITEELKVSKDKLFHDAK
jgi:hypothetical protein